MVTTVDRPEAEDHRPETLLLMAESRTTGQLLGAARLIHNGHVPLKLEQAFGVQGLFQSRFVAEAGRLTVLGIPESRMATLALVKAMYEICFHAGIEWAAITARRPMDRVYLAMQFDDVLNGRKSPIRPLVTCPMGSTPCPSGKPISDGVGRPARSILSWPARFTLISTWITAWFSSVLLTRRRTKPPP